MSIAYELVTVAELKALYDNLTAVQERCTQQQEELRIVKAERDEALLARDAARAVSSLLAHEWKNAQDVINGFVEALTEEPQGPVN